MGLGKCAISFVPNTHARSLTCFVGLLLCALVISAYADLDYAFKGPKPGDTPANRARVRRTAPPHRF